MLRTHPQILRHYLKISHGSLSLLPDSSLLYSATAVKQKGSEMPGKMHSNQ
jgi:hypothetical protein